MEGELEGELEGEWRESGGGASSVMDVTNYTK